MTMFAFFAPIFLGSLVAVVALTSRAPIAASFAVAILACCLAAVAFSAGYAARSTR